MFFKKQPLALASLAAGADGLLIEVHPDSGTALGDGPQSLTPEHFQELMDDIAGILPVLGKTLWTGDESK